jgi:hypothetical protein
VSVTRLVLWDIDGTLVNAAGDLAALCQAVSVLAAASATRCPRLLVS